MRIALIAALLAPTISALQLRTEPAKEDARGGRWASLGAPAILGQSHEAGLLINQPLIGFRHMSQEDSAALCPSNAECAAVPTSFFRNSPDFKESSCTLSQSGVQAVNHEKFNSATGVTTPIAELCREMYSLQNCVDTKGAKTDREYLTQREYITGVQCLRQQEEPFGCQCVPFSTPSLISHREELREFMMKEDGTRKKRPKEFPLAEFAAAPKEATGGATGSATGGETGGETGGATGSETGAEVDPFRQVEEKINDVASA